MGSIPSCFLKLVTRATSNPRGWGCSKIRYVGGLISETEGRGTGRSGGGPGRQRMGTEGGLNREEVVDFARVRGR